LGGCSADARCNTAAADYDSANYDGDSTPDDYFDANGPSTNSEHRAGSRESNDDGTNEPNRAAHAHHNQGSG
jgi:hypothetical protein